MLLDYKDGTALGKKIAEAVGESMGINITTPESQKMWTAVAKTIIDFLLENVEVTYDTAWRGYGVPINPMYEFQLTPSIKTPGNAVARRIVPSGTADTPDFVSGDPTAVSVREVTHGRLT